MREIGGAPRARRRLESGVGLRLAETRDAVAVFPLAAPFQDFDPLEALHDITFGAER